MKPHHLISAAMLVLLAACKTSPDANAPAAGNSAASQAPAGTDWLATTSETQDAGFLKGNPAAVVKLVEYGSLSCPHCAKFAAESAEGLKALIAKGTVSYEFRSFPIHPAQDVPATLLARCGGSSPFFPIMEQLMATQLEWNEKAYKYASTNQDALKAMNFQQQVAAIAENAGLIKFVGARGIPEAKARACLADKAGLDAINKVNTSFNEKGLTGTPTFFINGSKVDVGEWKDLEPLLKAAGA